MVKKSSNVAGYRSRFEDGEVVLLYLCKNKLMVTSIWVEYWTIHIWNFTLSLRAGFDVSSNAMLPMLGIGVPKSLPIGFVSFSYICDISLLYYQFCVFFIWDEDTYVGY